MKLRFVVQRVRIPPGARYALIVRPFDLDDRWSHLVLTDGMHEAIRERYVVAARMHEFRLHRPRDT